MLCNIFGANFVVYILRVVPFVLSIVQVLITRLNATIIHNNPAMLWALIMNEK